MAIESKHSSVEEKGSKKGMNEKEREIEELLSAHKTKIKVVGCGGAGNNTLSRLLDTGIADVVSIAVNTDAQDLLYAQADYKILIGREITHGLGAGSNPDIGERAGRESEEEIQSHLEGADLVFVTCGLGGGTGTGSAPVVAEVAQKVGALTIAVVSLPFAEEGVMRWQNARRGLERLRQHTDTVIIVQNDRLLEIAPDMPLNQAFKVADEILANAVKGITELVTEKGLVNLDFADVRAIMKDGGTAMIGLGESSSENKAIEAVEMAVRNPLLDVDISGAKSALINITGGSDMSLKDARMIMKTVAEKLDPGARVIWGARMDPELENTLRVMLIVTGLANDGRRFKEQQPDSEPQTPKMESGPDACAELIEEKIKSEEKTQTRDVFNKIFEEEASSDIEVLREATQALKAGLNSHTPLQDIKNAISSLNNTAQLFAFHHITELAEAVERMTLQLLADEMELTDEVVELLQKASVTFEDLMKDHKAAIVDAEEIVENIRRLIRGHLPRGHSSSHGVRKLEEAIYNWDSQPSAPSETGATADSKKTVGEMVSYVRNLLGDSTQSGSKA